MDRKRYTKPDVDTLYVSKVTVLAGSDEADVHNQKGNGTQLSKFRSFYDDWYDSAYSEDSDQEDIPTSE